VVCIAVLSVKGGVGKSTVTLGLAGAAWQRGLRVLVVDCDPQANATYALDPEEHPFTVNDVLADGRPGIAAEAIARSQWAGVDVLSSERALAHRDRASESPTRLRTTLAGAIETYDLVLLDCPPSLGQLARGALVAADAALVVVEPRRFAVDGAREALAAVDVVRPAYNLRLRTAGIVVNRCTSGSTRTHAELRREFGDLLLGPGIPSSEAVPLSQEAAVPVQAWQSSDARGVVEAFDDLLDVLLGGALGGGPELGAGKEST
jgi:chromosome partitioning protein